MEIYNKMSFWSNQGRLHAKVALNLIAYPKVDDSLRSHNFPVPFNQYLLGGLTWWSSG